MRNRYNNIFRSSIVFLLKMSINEKKETGKFTDVPSYEEHARHLYHQQQYEAALVEYSRLLQEHPKDENLMIMIGNCWDGRGDKNAAVEWYQKACRCNRRSVLALSNLATAFYEIGDYRRSLKCSCRALKMDARNLSALINQGNVLYQQKKYAAALEAYRKAFEINPQYFIAAVNLANTCLDLKDYEAAKSYAEIAVKLDSASVTAWTILGNAALELELADEALSAYRQAIKLDSSDPWLYNYLSQAWQKKNNWDEAFAAGWQAVEQSGGEEAQQINFGYLLYESTLEKQDSLLREYALKWLEKYPDNQVAQHMGNAVLNRAVRPRANDEYLKNIFDIFAPDFEQVLTGLDYRAPELIRCLLEEIYGGKKSPRLRILDAGCGTGFCGSFLKKYSSFRGLYGVDISEKMLEQAQAKKVYSHLLQSELEQYFSQAKTKFDLIVSADVFTYFGSLEKLLSGMADSLSAGGRVIFTVSENNLNDDDYFLHSSGRYLHHQNYVGKVLEKAGFEVEKLERAKLRNEGENIVYGYVVSALKK